MSIKVSIIDDHPIVLEGIRNMLSTFPEFRLLGTYLHFNDLMQGLQDNLPDILLLDIQMPGKTGDEAVPEILLEFPNLKIIVFSNVDAMSYVHNLLGSGIKGYLLKSTDPLNLAKAINIVYEGSEILDSVLSKAYYEFCRKMKRAVYLKPKLTPREKQIVQLIANGDSSQEIADKLFISVRTVEFYRLNIMTKMDVNNAAALVHQAVTLGFIL